MELKSFDILLLFIFAIIVSIIIGYNIIYIIDKKLSNVTINIPTINIPKQNITLKLLDNNNKECNFEIINNKENSQNKKTESQKDILSEDSNSDISSELSSELDTIENFSSVSNDEKKKIN